MSATSILSFDHFVDVTNTTSSATNINYWNLTSSSSTFVGNLGSITTTGTYHITTDGTLTVGPYTEPAQRPKVMSLKARLIQLAMERRQGDLSSWGWGASTITVTPSSNTVWVSPNFTTYNPNTTYVTTATAGWTPIPTSNGNAYYQVLP